MAPTKSNQSPEYFYHRKPHRLPSYKPRPSGHAPSRRAPSRRIKKLPAMPLLPANDARYNLNQHQVSAILQFIEDATTNGEILTWSSETNNPTPTVWNLPCHRTSSGSWTQFGASAYNSLPSIQYPLPQCGHAISGFLSEDETRMTAVHNKNDGWFFQAKAHRCEFKMKIPPRGSTNLEAGSSEDEDAGHWAGSSDREESFTVMALDAETAREVAAVNKATEERMAEEAQKKIAQEAFQMLTFPPPYSPGWLPSYPSSSPSASTSSSPLRPRLSSTPGGISSYFSANKAMQRAAYNKHFAVTVQDNQVSGHYKKYPEAHPAWKAGLHDAPAIMVVYHPDSLRSYTAPMTLMTTLCGVMLSELNSTMGLPKLTFLRLLVQSIVCEVCACAFSVEGYDAHRQMHKGKRVCSNTPDLYQIEEKSPEIEGLYDMKTRSYPVGISLPTHTVHTDCMIGRAWIAWNSRIGVLLDVWAILASAWVHCRDCDLVHSFEGDRAHRDINNLCVDVGQGIVGTIARGQDRRDGDVRTLVRYSM
ncbi:hypothetical protein C8R47DRAFT_1148378 [Mycena vitilis]|nr:hypothetical protein C8R47DRAFT_1148378 [Mycena vitilis]